MSEIRVHRDRDHVVMATHHLHNTGLSLKGKGLMSLMLSLPDEWDYSINGLVAISKENKTAIRSALKELQEAGYVVVTKLMPDKKAGRSTIKYEYDLYETPVEKGHQEDKKQGTENLYLDNLDIEDRPQYNKHSTCKNKPTPNRTRPEKNKRTNNSAREKPKPADRFKELVEEGRSHVLENCTEEQFDRLMEAVVPMFARTRKRQDMPSQKALCRKTVDELYGYAKEHHPGYAGDIVYDTLAAGARGRSIEDRYLSYWLSDGFEGFKADMRVQAEYGDGMRWSKW